VVNRSLTIGAIVGASTSLIIALMMIEESAQATAGVMVMVNRSQIDRQIDTRAIRLDIIADSTTETIAGRIRLRPQIIIGQLVIGQIS
jgi:hypothetical protein